MRNNHHLFKNSGYFLISFFIVFALIVLPSCGGETKTDNTTATDTTTENTTKQEGDFVNNDKKTDAEVLSTLKFYHLKIDSATLVDSFFKKNPSMPGNQFNKILFSYRVTDPSKFPASLTLEAQTAKQNGDMVDNNPELLTILTDYESLPSDIVFSTLEISRLKLRNLVGNNGQAGGRRYTHLLLIPSFLTKNNIKYLTYRLVLRPSLGEADEASEDLNPCPPYKPD